MPPSMKIAIVTCMDARIDVYYALGLHPGEAHVIRNAGGVISDDVLRSLAVSQRKLGTEEILVIHHSDCGMLTFTDEVLEQEIVSETGHTPTWTAHTFTDLAQDVRDGVKKIRNAPELIHKDRVSGYILDVETYELTPVTN
ncbi:beta-class carbonic anhydrase [Schaalia vaccimaxillae]|uniref:beta-class carbonic anhydrase n=1 Tax=Schaalia vaccimaxillae TaxID=183916 RepID=UPI00041D52DC|nr:carbonic anhydrase [Schaalia vaccimaxillae]